MSKQFIEQPGTCTPLPYQARMNVDAVAEWIQTVIPDEDLAKQYADDLRGGFVDGDTMDTFPMGGDELTDYGIQKRHCRTILAKWAKLSSAGEGPGASADPPVPPLSPQSSGDLQPGMAIDRYKIGRLVYRSDKSKIFVASEEGEEYVLKQILDLTAFHHEVACLKAVKSKDPTCLHVVKFCRSFQESGNFIVMEKGGETAVQWRESCGMPIAAMLLKIGLDLVNASEFLHTQVGLIHCDIKLSNLVWFAGPKKFKLIDIGTAQKAGGELREYTVNNLPPEAAQCALDSRPVQASVAFDMWTVGMALLSVCNPQWLEQVLDTSGLDIGDPANRTTILRKIANPSMVNALNLSEVPHGLQTILLGELLCVNPTARVNAATVRAHSYWQGSATVGTHAAHKKITGNDFVQRPWHFRAAAKGQAFDAVPGFSHRVRTIYKKVGTNGQVQRDEAFGSELDQLIEAFDSTSAGAVEIVEVDAIVNPQREAALEAQLVQWKERTDKGGGV
jgi:hypothetical protein